MEVFMSGFLGTAASLRSDLVLITTWLLLIVAIIGFFQARKQRFDTHESIMPWAVLLNWIPILIVMIPVILRILTSGVHPAGSAYFTQIFLHSGLGLVTQLLLTYTVVRMKWAPNLPPKNPLWLMRIALILWVLTVLGGTYFYLVAYVMG
jgi:purine-cytosine permease-like protein